jgi:isopenicillin N synthase-like dioxygenase
MSFASIPILDLSLARDEATKPQFLAHLRRALLEVGFLYITNTGIEHGLVQRVVDNGKAFFALPRDQKLQAQMRNKPSFLGMALLIGNFFKKERFNFLLSYSWNASPSLFFCISLSFIHSVSHAALVISYDHFASLHDKPFIIMAGSYPTL